MKPFKQLSAKDLSFLQHFSESTQNVAAFLTACFDNLRETSGWLIEPYPSGNFAWKISIDANRFDEIWGSISKYVTRNEVPIGVSLTCSCDSEGAFFFLHIWDEKPMATKHFERAALKAKRFERAALKAKLEKDKDAKDYAQYVLRLSTVPDSSRTLPRKLADEVLPILDRVFRELTSHGSKQ